MKKARNLAFFVLFDFLEIFGIKNFNIDFRGILSRHANRAPATHPSHHTILKTTKTTPTFTTFGFRNLDIHAEL